MKKFNILFLLTLLVVAGCAKDDIAEQTAVDLKVVNENEANDIAPFRPYKGSVDYVVDMGIDLTCECPDPSFIAGRFSGTGNITHMGNVTAENIPCITAHYDGSGNIIGFDVGFTCESLVAANGDELYVSTEPYTLLFDFDCFCKYSGVAVANFTGGTGRFEDAEGGYEMKIVNDLDTGVVTVTYDGQISY